MGRTVTINIQLDEAVPQSMEAACAELGLSMSEAFTIFAKKVAGERRIPFEVSAAPFYSERNIKYFEQKPVDYKAGRLSFSEHRLM